MTRVRATKFSILLGLWNLFIFIISIDSSLGSTDQPLSTECETLLTRFWKEISQEEILFSHGYCHWNAAEILENLLFELRKSGIPHKNAEAQILFFTHRRSYESFLEAKTIYLSPLTHIPAEHGLQTQNQSQNHTWTWHVVAEFRGMIFDLEAPQLKRTPMPATEYFRALDSLARTNPILTTTLEDLVFISYSLDTFKEMKNQLPERQAMDLLFASDPKTIDIYYGLQNYLHSILQEPNLTMTENDERESNEQL